MALKFVEDIQIFSYFYVGGRWLSHLWWIDWWLFPLDCHCSAFYSFCCSCFLMPVSIVLIYNLFWWMLPLKKKQKRNHKLSMKIQSHHLCGIYLLIFTTLVFNWLYNKHYGNWPSLLNCSVEILFRIVNASTVMTFVHDEYLLSTLFTSFQKSLEYCCTAWELYGYVLS